MRLRLKPFFRDRPDHIGVVEEELLMVRGPAEHFKLFLFLDSPFNLMKHTQARLRYMHIRRAGSLLGCQWIQEIPVLILCIVGIIRFLQYGVILLLMGQTLAVIALVSTDFTMQKFIKIDIFSQ